MKKLILGLAGLAVLVSGLTHLSCAQPRHIAPRVQYDVEKERVISKTFETVWQSAVEWFAMRNTPIKNIDKTSGFISTEYGLSVEEAAKYMDSGYGESNFQGHVAVVNHRGNFNVLIKKVDENSTRVSVNAFFNCTVNRYRYENILSTNLVLESSTPQKSDSTGALEKELLNYLSRP